MTSKNFSSKGLLGNSMRRNLWALVLSGVGFFLSLLLPALMTMQNALEQRVLDLKEIPQAHVEINWQNAMNNAASMLSGGNLFVKIVFIVLAVVCGVAMFAYLHSRQKVDFYHSLPISRTRLFANNFLTGVVCTFSTYLVMLALGRDRRRDTVQPDRVPADLCADRADHRHLRQHDHHPAAARVGVLLAHAGACIAALSA